jgi:transposase
MSTKRHEYYKEFKVEAVRLVLEINCRISEVAVELDIRANMLGRWIKRYEGGKLE